MQDKAKVYWLHALTSLHVGAGRGVGFIDLPIMREKATNWPIVPGSSIKGVLRDAYTPKNKENEQWPDLIKVAFGQRENNDGGKKEKEDTTCAGALVLTDARIVLLPIRSLYGTFAYVTSPLVLQRLKRDLDSCEFNQVPEVPEFTEDEGYCKLPEEESKLYSEKQEVFLEDYDFQAKKCPLTQQWADYFSEILFSENAWKKLFKERFVIVPDHTFDFLVATGTEVNARIRIKDNTKTVTDGGLWYEEALPAETVMAGIAWCDRTFDEKIKSEKVILNTFCSKELLIQVGGKATVGKGRVRCLFKGGCV